MLNLSSSITTLGTSVWLEDPRHVRALLAALASSSPRAERVSRSQSTKPYTITDRVAELPIEGHILRDVPTFFGDFGIKATGTLQLEAAINAALIDPEVDAILLHISSPGGTLAGVQPLADLVREAREAKPIHAHTDDLAASAAYWIGSQASRFTACEAAEVGSIGVYTVIPDESRLFERAGIDVKVVRSGPHKGVGVVGAKVTDEQLARVQKQIDAAADLFVKAVSNGRGLSSGAARELATGELWFAEEATRRQLLDGVESRECALELTRQTADAKKPTSPRSIAHVRAPRKEKPMELSTILEKLTAEEQAFLQNMITPAPPPDPIATFREVVRVWFDEERSAQQKLERQIAELRELLGSTMGDDGGSPLAKLNAQAKAIRAHDSKLSEEQAFKLACERHPDLYREYRGD